MFTCQHFRTEFIRQSQATIVKKVTMTQFLFILAALFFSLMVFDIPLLLVPFFAGIGWGLGYQLNGEFVYKRLYAYGLVYLRAFWGTPRTVNLSESWQAFAESQQANGQSLQVTVAIQSANGELIY